jgi:hypothetical protein
MGLKCEQLYSGSHFYKPNAVGRLAIFLGVEKLNYIVQLLPRLLNPQHLPDFPLPFLLLTSPPPHRYGRDVVYVLTSPFPKYPFAL